MKLIASLDMETLDLGIRCQVFDIACVVAKIEEDREPREVRKELIRLDLVEQMRLGRTASPQTVEFHEKQRGAEAFRQHLYGTSDYSVMSVSKAFEVLRDCTDKVEEVWINGLSFDSAILQSLGVDVKDTKPLWWFRKERDVRTIRETITWVHRETDRSTVAHDAYQDTLWNISVVDAYYRWLKRIPVKYRR